MAVLANAATLAPETEQVEGSAVVLVQNLITDYPLQFEVPTNEVWQIIYMGMRFVLTGKSTTTILGARGFIRNPANTQPASAQASTTEIAGQAAPRGTFIITPGVPYGEVGPGRAVGLSVTLVSTAIGDDVEEAQLVAEIRRFRLVTDPSVLTVQPERAQMEALNLRLLNRR